MVVDFSLPLAFLEAQRGQLFLDLTDVDPAVPAQFSLILSALLLQFGCILAECCARKRIGLQPSSLDIHML